VAPVAPFLVSLAAGLLAPPYLHLALVGLVALLLYALLRDRRAAERPPPWRAALFALLGGLIAASFTMPRAAERATAGVPARAFERYTEAMLQAKATLALESAGGATAAAATRMRAIRLYREAIAAAPTAPRFRRELGIFLGATEDRKGALAELRQAADALSRLGMAERAREEKALWSAIYGAAPPPRAEVSALRARVEALSLGWFRHLALEALYRRAGMQNDAEKVRRVARQEAIAQQLAMGALLLGLFGAGFVGFGISVTFAVKAARGAWRPVQEPLQGPAFPLWEAFLLYLAVNAAPALLRGVLTGREGAPGAGDTASTIIGWILFADALVLLPLIYLALAYRRRGLSLAAIGLHAREAGSEVLRGVGGYAAMLPWLLLVAVLTQWAGRQFFPEVAPPFHPVQALTVGAPSPWARVALFLIVAVFAPVWEEIFFRGVLQGALRRRFGAALSVLTSAAIFAALHPQLPLGFLPIFLIGAFLGGIYEWRRSLLPAIVLHAINNGVIFLLLTLLFPPSR
jgi:membrane protease YdiL (CAAX protease family)